MFGEISQEPIKLFKEWFDEAQTVDSVKEPTWMTLASATEDGRPSARIVLLKGLDDRGFHFFTNLTSRKGKELVKNPHAALCFYWDTLEKQVRVEGRVSRISEKEADDYFITRSRGSQIGAWSSKQSLPMESLDGSDLVERVKDISAQFEGQPIPRPPFWSGFILEPTCIEFWDAGQFRLHKRLVYRRETTHTPWETQRLYP
jgi:pyridoxamine 5'-phosphate oxidase